MSTARRCTLVDFSETRAAMTPHTDIETRRVPTRVAELGFAVDLPRGWVLHEAPDETPDRLTVWTPAFSATVTLPRALSVGASFTGLTVTVKLRVKVLLAAWPSFTVTVMVALPVPFATGVKANAPVVFGLA